jgi:4-hydroxy-3-methylbut-2-enyl diphosphate reductase
MLAKIAVERGIKHVLRLESIEQLDTSILSENMRIAITAGASTPSKITQQIIDYLTAYDFERPSKLPSVDIDTLLDE